MTTFVVRSWATILLLFLGCATASAEEPRTVLVLYSEQWLTPSTNVLTDSIRKSLSSAPAVVLEAQYLDISRFAGESHDRALAGS